MKTHSLNSFGQPNRSNFLGPILSRILAGVSLTSASLSIALLVGCGGGEESIPTVPNSDSSGTTASAASNGAAPAGTLTSTTVVQNGIETDAAQIVAIFLDSLRRGDERAANGVLTDKALQELAKTDYTIQPLGTPEGQYQIGRVGYPYEDKTVALVECTWQEPATATDEAVIMDIVCEVHQEQNGWRIAGIGVTIPGTQEALVLDFENAASLQATIDAATGQTTPAQNTATAQNTAQNTAQTTGMPQYPSMNNGPAMNNGQTAGEYPALPGNGMSPAGYPPAGQGTTQIANPGGQYDSSINR